MVTAACSSSVPVRRSALRRLSLWLALWLALGPALMPAGAQAADALPLARLQLPPGFHIELLARVPDARQMALADAVPGSSDGGTPHMLYVGSRQQGKVHAVPLTAQWRQAGQVQTVASGLQMPSGVAWRQGSLYVAAVDRILRFDGLGRAGARPPPVVINDQLPRDTHHGWKFIAFGPDGWLYVPVGAPCNICEPDADRYAAILRMRPDGSALQTYARGIRNTVGFDWRPGTQELWFTDNGRDMLGDDAPPDELNRATQPGQHFGYPYCHAGTLADPEHGAKRSCGAFTPPVQALGAHVAGLGMRFYTGSMFPAAYRGQVFIAEHGSWNRSTKSGYRVTLVSLDAQGRATAYTPFITGWLQGDTAWGRPTDVLVLPDGSLLVSDDRADAIYRVRYEAPAR